MRQVPIYLEKLCVNLLKYTYINYSVTSYSPYIKQYTYVLYLFHTFSIVNTRWHGCRVVKACALLSVWSFMCLHRFPPITADSHVTKNMQNRPWWMSSWKWCNRWKLALLCFQAWVLLYSLKCTDQAKWTANNQ